MKLDGYKTYIMVVLGALSIGGYAAGLYDREILELFLALFGLGSIASLRDAINKK